jgi:ceramide synthetase
MKVPGEIQFLYFIECGFYLHAIYATLYMDEVRRDFMVMMSHHAITLSLISISRLVENSDKIGISQLKLNFF